MPNFSLIGVLSIIHLISLLISAIASLVLYRAYKRSGDMLVKYFMWFLVSVFFWMAAYFLTLLFTTGVLTQSKGWELATSHGFFLIGLAFLARAFARLSMPRLEKPIFGVSMGIALLVTIGGMVLRSPLGGLTPPEANRIIILISAVFTLLVLLPSIFLFLYRSATSENENVAVRSFLIGIGFLLLLWHGVSLVAIPTYGVLPWLIGEALNVVAFSLLLAGMLYQAPAPEKTFTVQV